MHAIDSLIAAKRAASVAVQRARRRGDSREWAIVLGHDKKTVYLKYGTTTKNAKVWLSHLTKEAYRSGAYGPGSSVSSNTIEVRLVGGTWVPLDSHLVATAVRHETKRRSVLQNVRYAAEALLGL